MCARLYSSVRGLTREYHTPDATGQAARLSIDRPSIPAATVIELTVSHPQRLYEFAVPQKRQRTPRHVLWQVAWIAQIAHGFGGYPGLHRPGAGGCRRTPVHAACADRSVGANAIAVHRGRR